MRFIITSILIATSVIFSSSSFAQCWPPGRDLSSVELTACFMAEFQRCEEQVPSFKNQASKGIEKFTNHSRYREVSKSKDFERFKQEAYKNLSGQSVSSGCSSKLTYLEKGVF